MTPSSQARGHGLDVEIAACPALLVEECRMLREHQGEAGATDMGLGRRVFGHDPSGFGRSLGHKVWLVLLNDQRSSECLHLERLSLQSVEH